MNDSVVPALLEDTEDEADFYLGAALDLITVGGFYKDWSLEDVVTEILANRQGLRNHFAETETPKGTIQ